MNDLLFYALLIALIYYFFIYLPSQKQLSNQTPTSPSPIFNTQGTQTETITSESEPGPSDTLNGSQILPDLTAIKKLTQEVQALTQDNQQKEQTIIGLNHSYEKLETKKKQELEQLTEQLKEKTQQLAAEKVLEKDLDTLIQNIQDLKSEIE